MQRTWWIDQHGRTRWAREWPRPVALLVGCLLALGALVGQPGAALGTRLVHPRLAQVAPAFDRMPSGGDGCVTLTWCTRTFAVDSRGEVVETVQASSASYTTPGGFDFLIPTGTTSITFDVKGGGGGCGANGGSPLPGANGGRAQGTLAVTPGQTVRIGVGQGGQGGTKTTVGTAGTNPGGAGGISDGASGAGGAGGTFTWTTVAASRYSGGGGGGRSSITIAGTLYFVAGGGGASVSGGGGGGGQGGGNGAGDNGDGIGYDPTLSGAGGGGGVGGAGASRTAANLTAGGNGTATNGGAGASQTSGGAITTYTGAGGGGGYGGGGGGTYGCCQGAGGGGGFIHGTVTSPVGTKGGGAAGAAVPALNVGSNGSDGSVGMTYLLVPTTPGVFTNPAAASTIPVAVAITVGWGTSTDPEGGGVTYQLYYRLNGGAQVLIDAAVGTNSKSWTPSTPGSYQLDVYATSTTTAKQSAVRSVSFTVAPAGGPRAIIG